MKKWDKKMDWELFGRVFRYLGFNARSFLKRG